MREKSRTQRIIEELEVGSKYVEDIVDKVCRDFPDTDCDKMRAYVLRILARIRRKAEKRYEDYIVIPDMYKIVKKVAGGTMPEESYLPESRYE